MSRVKVERTVHEHNTGVMDVQSRLFWTYSVWMACILLFVSGSLADPSEAESAWPRARAYASESRWAEALHVLDSAEKAHPREPELIMGQIRVLAWSGNMSKADSLMQAVTSAFGTRSDFRLLRADLAFYQGDLDSAQAGYASVLELDPDSEEARAGFQKVEVAQKTQLKKDKAGRWSTTAGGEVSVFRRRPYSPWNEQFLQAEYASPTNQASIEGKAVLYRRFDRSNTEFETKAQKAWDVRHDGKWLASLDFSFSPNGDYRPWLATGVAASFQNILFRKGLGRWELGGQFGHDTYAVSDVISSDIYFAVYLNKGWEARFAALAVAENTAAPGLGQAYRVVIPLLLDGTLQCGYARAPESVAGDVVFTESWALGINWTWTSLTLRIGAGQEERDNSFIRTLGYMNVTYRP